MTTLEIGIYIFTFIFIVGSHFYFSRNRKQLQRKQDQILMLYQQINTENQAE